MSSLSIPAQLLRGFAVDFLTAHAPAAAEVIMSPRYRLSIGGHLFDGRDGSYLPATVAQLEQFPGLCVTIHDVVLAPHAVAMRFTEHGASAKGGAVSTWGGITLFRLEDGQLEHGWAEEDYFARKRQLKTGEADSILPPHAAPWDRPVEQEKPETERLVRQWLGRPATVFEDAEEISAQGPQLAQLVTPEKISISFLFAAGNRAAVHAIVSGRYEGGFVDVPDSVGTRVSVPIAAIIDVANGAIHRLQICGDRLGLNRSLLPARSERDP
jgi:predicted ester cyclase